MKIQCLIRRKSGSTVEMGGNKYVFNDANDHTCEVENEAHADRLLQQKPTVFVTVGPMPEKSPDGQSGEAQAKVRKPRVKKEGSTAPDGQSGEAQE